jgi:hypothetical protein
MNDATLRWPVEQFATPTIGGTPSYSPPPATSVTTTG